MTGINQYVNLEEPELGDVAALLVAGHEQIVRVMARHDAEHLVVQPAGSDELLVVDADDNNLCPLQLGGPFAVHAQDEDGETYVRSFRTERAARVFAAGQQVA